MLGARSHDPVTSALNDPRVRVCVCVGGAGLCHLGSESIFLEALHSARMTLLVLLRACVRVGWGVGGGYGWVCVRESDRGKPVSGKGVCLGVSERQGK